MSGTVVVLRIPGAVVGHLLQRIRFLFSQPDQVLLPEWCEAPCWPRGLEQALLQRLQPSDTRWNRGQRIRTAFVARFRADRGDLDRCVRQRISARLAAL